MSTLLTACAVFLIVQTSVYATPIWKNQQSTFIMSPRRIFLELPAASSSQGRHTKRRHHQRTNRPDKRRPIAYFNRDKLVLDDILNSS